MADADLPGALERVTALLAPHQRGGSTLTAGRGYLDLLGDEGPRSTGTAQNLMLTAVVPAIYERWWRPALGRIAKGLMGPSMAEERRIARLLLGLVPGDGVLDVACGPGNFTRDFGRVVGPGGLAIGIDASASMLAKAARDTPVDRHPAVGYVRGDAAVLPFRDASFDAVCCFAALHLFGDPFSALDHMSRVLSPGGRIAILTSCRMRSSPMRTIDGALGSRSGIRMFERSEIVEALSQRGFRDVRQRVSGLTQVVGGRLE